MRRLHTPEASAGIGVSYKAAPYDIVRFGRTLVRPAIPVAQLRNGTASLWVPAYQLLTVSFPDDLDASALYTAPQCPPFTQPQQAPPAPPADETRPPPTTHRPVTVETLRQALNVGLVLTQVSVDTEAMDVVAAFVPNTHYVLTRPAHA